ncbi:MAG: helicase associated domain-containing protein [Deltaproteobacteria bacterium]|nr:helicase associated domain-containing protein [Deltaproteobacteria bacterium]
MKLKTEEFEHKTKQAVPQSFSTLGLWVSKQRQRRRKGLFPEEKIKRLDDIGFTWESKG